MDISTANQHEAMLLARGYSMSVYSSLEMHMATLMARLCETDLRTASIIFYRIVNTRSRLVQEGEILVSADCAQLPARGACPVRVTDSGAALHPVVARGTRWHRGSDRMRSLVVPVDEILP